PVYRRATANLSFSALFVARAAAALPSALNFHLGQVYLTVLLTRGHRVSPASASGLTLLSYATLFGGTVAAAAVTLPLWVGRAPALLPYVVGLVVTGLL